MNQTISQPVSTQSGNTIHATIHRLQRPYDYNPGSLARDEFLSYACCSAEYPGNPHPASDHEPRLGVYKAIPLGTVVGGSPLQKVGSYIRTKLANLRAQRRS